MHSSFLISFEVRWIFSISTDDILDIKNASNNGIIELVIKIYLKYCYSLEVNWIIQQIAQIWRVNLLIIIISGCCYYCLLQTTFTKIGASSMYYYIYEKYKFEVKFQRLIFLSLTNLFLCSILILVPGKYILMRMNIYKIIAWYFFNRVQWLLVLYHTNCWSAKHEYELQ